MKRLPAGGRLLAKERGMGREELLSEIRKIVREELANALHGQMVSAAPLSSSNLNLRNIALVMGLNIFPKDFEDLIEQYKAHGNLPSSMKESWQRFEDWGKSREGSIAASLSHRAYLDMVAERRRQLKQEGKWPVKSKKSKKTESIRGEPG